MVAAIVGHLVFNIGLNFLFVRDDSVEVHMNHRIITTDYRIIIIREINESCACVCMISLTSFSFLNRINSEMLLDFQFFFFIRCEAIVDERLLKAIVSIELVFCKIIRCVFIILIRIYVRFTTAYSAH